MASLEELRKRLYQEKETFNERMGRPELARPGAKKSILWGAGNEPPKPQQKKRRWIIGSILIAVILLGFFFIFKPFSFLKFEAINIEITGVKEVKSGERVSWQVKVTNANSRDLEDAVLVFNFPKDASPINGSKPQGIFRERRSLGTLKNGESVSQTFDAFVFGGRGSEKDVSAVLEYRPAGASAIFAKDVSFFFTIVSSPVNISFNIPEEVRIGQEIEIGVNYNSASSDKISNLYLALEFPEGFGVISSSPSPLPNLKNIWKINDLKPGESGLIKVKGVIRGSNSEPKTFKGAIGILDAQQGKIVAPYDEIAAVAVLRSPFLEVSILANGKSDYISFPGDTITFEIFWKNNLPVDVKNAVLEVKFTDQTLDLRSLQIDNGSYNEASQSILWTASTYDKFSLLPAGTSDKFSFSAKVKNSLPLDSSSVRPKVNVILNFKSGGPVPGFEKVEVGGESFFEVKVSSKFQLAARALYNNSTIPNSGPLPPKSGKETTYTVIWSLTNMSNDLADVSVKASLPPYINFKNILSPADANIIYDRGSGTVEWKVGRVLAGTGFLRPALEVAFQVGFIPSQNQIGSSPIIINETEVSGRDTFTNQVLISRDPQITTELPDDSGVSFNQRSVVE